MKRDTSAPEPGYEASDILRHGDVFTETHRQELITQGWTVVRDVLPRDQVDLLVNQAYEWIENLGTGIRRGDASTWTSDRWPFNVHGIIQKGDVGQSDWVWSIRTQVKPVFEDMYGTTRLVTSFDGASFDPPQEQTKILQDIEGRASMHVDQGGTRTGLHTVQGMVTLFDIDECDSTLRIVPRSHLLQRPIFRALLEETKDKEKLKKAGGYRFSDKDLERLVLKPHGLELKRVSMPAGSIVLWDSRLIHGKGGPQLPRPIPRWRIVSYVCMTPARWCTKAALRKRVRAFEQVRMTMHNPHEVKLFSAMPRTYGSIKLMEKWNKFQWRTNPPDVTPTMRGLVGYTWL